MGTVLGLVVPIVTAGYRISQTKTTDFHQSQIVSALASYVLANRRLPAAALSSDGRESQIGQGRLSVGFVPYMTLGLPESVAKDGYGRWFTYAVHGGLTRTVAQAHPRQDEFCEIRNHHIRIKSAETGQDLANKTGNPVAFVIISHGAEGGGALLSTGERLRSQGLESTNSDASQDFYEGSAPGFGHKVFWVTRDNLMAIYAKSPCQNFSQGNDRSQRGENRL